MTERCNCIVPGCRRTRGTRKGDDQPTKADDEWICADHWKLVSRRVKALRTRFERRLKRCEARGSWSHDGEQGWWAWKAKADFLEHRKLCRVLEGLWERMKRQAIEKAMGI